MPCQALKIGLSDSQITAICSVMRTSSSSKVQFTSNLQRQMAQVSVTSNSTWLCGSFHGRPARLHPAAGTTQAHSQSHMPQASNRTTSPNTAVWRSLKYHSDSHSKYFMTFWYIWPSHRGPRQDTKPSNIVASWLFFNCFRTLDSRTASHAPARMYGFLLTALLHRLHNFYSGTCTCVSQQSQAPECQSECDPQRLSAGTAGPATWNISEKCTTQR